MQIKTLKKIIATTYLYWYEHTPALSKNCLRIIFLVTRVYFNVK